MLKHRVQQRVERGIRERAVALRIMPPVIHQHIEGFKRLNVVPPQRGNENRIAGAKFGRLGGRQRLAELGVALEVGMTQRHEAHRRAGGSEVERTDIQVGHLLRREQREAAPPGDHAADVVPLIDMSGRGDPIAEPDPRQHIVVDYA